MLTNEKQYALTKEKLEGLRQRMAELNAEGDRLSVTKRLILASILDFSTGMEEEIAECDLRAKASK
jgi:hypothetical protein